VIYEKNEIWQQAQSWVSSNKPLIWGVASPHYRYMSCDSGDLFGEAQLVFYKVFSTLLAQNKDLSLTPGYFKVVFRTRCIQMATGVHGTVLNFGQDIPSKEKQPFVEVDNSAVVGALLALTHRQRQVSMWILEQPHPVSVATIAKHFGIHGRTIREIISNSIKRIENSSNLKNHKIAKGIN
jgi:DNA-binding CsgD family transcriptional regulator